jgi:hypothetical protein
MTTYSHTITLNDSQRISLEAALDLMIRHCDEQLADGPRAPFWAHRQSCEEIRKKLFDCTPNMTSTNDFWRER